MLNNAIEFDGILTYILNELECHNMKIYEMYDKIEENLCYDMIDDWFWIIILQIISLILIIVLLNCKSQV